MNTDPSDTELAGSGEKLHRLCDTLRNVLFGHGNLGHWCVTIQKHIWPERLRLFSIMSGIWLCLAVAAPAQQEPAKPMSSDLDRFGVKMLFETAPGGREWFNRWNEGMRRAITWGADSLDPEFIVRGSGICVIHGKTGDHAGEMKVTGEAPRLYVRGSQSESIPPPAGTSQWNNVEVTFYGMTTNAGSRLSYAGLEAVCKTNHFPDSDDASTKGYGGRVLFDGRVDIEKELSHRKGSNIRTFPAFIWTETDGGDRSKDSSLTGDNGGKPVYELPLNKWIGVKLVARNCDHDASVLVELYVDKTNGRNGGDWRLVKSIKDIRYDPAEAGRYFSRELWYDAADFKSKGSAVPAQHGKPLTAPDYSIYLRTDGNIEQYYKFFSVREIEAVK